MVQPGKNPSPDEPFESPNVPERSDTGLEGVVEELKNVLSGLNSEPEATVNTATPDEQPVSETSYPFTPVAPLNVPLSDEIGSAAPELPVESQQDSPPPSDAEFWNGNVLGWTDKSTDAPPPAEEVRLMPAEELSSPLPVEEPVPPSEPEPKPISKPTPEDLLPPLPPSPFDEDKAASAPPAAASVPPVSPPPDIVAPLPVIPVIARPPIEEEDDDFKAEKPEGLIQIACIYPKGFEKPGQQFVSSLRSACEKAKVPMNIQPVYIQPWVSDAIDVLAWAKASHLAGADRLFIMALKKDQDQFKSVGVETASVGIPGRLVFIEHVGLRSLYADILVELRRPK